MSAATTRPADPAERPPHPIGELLTGSVASIGFTLLAVIAAGLVSIGPRFLTADNIAIIGQSVAVPMIVGACSGFALLAGVVDLSIGSMVGFSSALFATLLSDGWNAWLAAGGTLLACVGCATVGAIAIVGFGADAIAATLGTLTALRGITFLIVGPLGSIAALQPELFEFTNQTIWNLPLLLLLTLLATAVAAVVVNHTRVGRHVRAVGGDDRAAARAGIAVAGIRVAALLLSALGAGVGGILYVGQLGSAAKATGLGLEFQVYAALMIGGYSILRGGVGNPIGGALGLLVVAGVGNVLDLLSINPYYVNIVVGVLLLAAVLLDRLRGGDAYE
jgi:ribose transport system permease protein